MKCNQTKCQWNVSHECMKPMWMECPLSNMKPKEESLLEKADRIFSDVERISQPFIPYKPNKGKKPKPKDRVNPNRKPVSKATLKKMQGLITSDSINLSMALFLTVLFDKFGYTAEKLHDVWDAVNSLSDGVAKGYVNINDLLRVLDEEYGITIKV